MGVTSKREQLLGRKIEIDELLSNAKIDIDEAKAVAAAGGGFLPPMQMANMKRRLARLQRESQKLQFELRGDRKQIHAVSDQKGDLFMQEFFMVARRVLPKDQFTAIVKETDARLTEQAKRITERTHSTTTEG